MSLVPGAAAVVGFVAEHWDLVELAYDVVIVRKVPKTIVMGALKELLTAASDAEFEKELAELEQGSD